VLNRIFAFVLALPLLLVMVVIVMINISLNYEPELTVSKGDTIDCSILKELTGLKGALDNRADAEMQNIYPEGYVFLNSVYALAWLAFLDNEQHAQYLDAGLSEIEKAWLKINSSTGKAPFNEDLSLPYGAFYNGWSTYVLGSKLMLENNDQRREDEVAQFRQQCEWIAAAIQKQTFPPSYYGGTWPTDVVLCVASLALYDKVFETRYKDVIAEWVSQVRTHLDENGMIPHSISSGKGKVKENARGSSMSLMLIFLHEINPQFAQEQFVIFKENFIHSKLGLTGVREYPKGQFGTGDVDSGPVILGFGGAATIVGMQTLSLFGEHTTSLKIRNTVEAMAFPMIGENDKVYFFGLLPIADAFICWSHGSMISSNNEISFLQFRLYSGLIFILLATFFWILIRKKRISSEKSLIVPW
jgi:hypothetical protein